MLSFPYFSPWERTCQQNHNCTRIFAWMTETGFVWFVFNHNQGEKTVVYSNVVYCPNVVVGWRSGVRRRKLCVRCEGGCANICRQTPTTHIISTTEPLYVISIKYRLSLPDDGSCVIRNTLEYFFNVAFRLLHKIVFNVYDCYNWVY
jgi:hypothetical protein